MSEEDPTQQLLDRLPDALRSQVAAARDSGDWTGARAAILAAAKARPGPRHVVYGRLLLALDEFDLCRSVLDRIDPEVLDNPAELVDLRAELLLEEAASRTWSPVPGRPEQRVPTSRTAVDAVRQAVADARALGPTSPWTLSQITQFERAVVWASGSARTGGLVGPLGAACVGLILGLHGVRTGGGPWLAAALTWLAAAPLLVRAGTRPQWQVNAAVVEGRQSLDDRFLAALAKGPPLVAPLGLAARLMVHGLLAPLAVLWRSLEGRRIVPPIALIALAAWAFHSAPAIDTPAPEPTAVPASGPITVAGIAWRFGEPPPEVASGSGFEPQLDDGKLRGLVVRANGASPPPVLAPGWMATDEALLSPEGATCRVTSRRYSADDSLVSLVSLRTTACGAGPATQWTLELQAR